MSLQIPITKTAASKISSIDFDNLHFGDVFADHMLVSDYKDGRWSLPQIVPYGNLTFAPSMRSLHYGQEIFEGMKAYKDAQGKAWLFRPEENARRLNVSAKRLAMPELPEEYFLEGLKALVRLDIGWIPSKENTSLYIRPFMFASEESIRASEAKEYKFIIFCCPVGAYYSNPVSVKIADYYSRASDGGIGFTKAAGNYAGQFYPTKLAEEEGFQQIIWTDSGKHEYLEEAGTMNLFFRINDTLITAPTGTRILDGVTRKSLIALAKDQGISVEERFLTVQELIAAHENQTLKEIFGSGTAAVVSFVKEFGYKGRRFPLADMGHGGYAALLKKQLTDIQYNRAEDKFGWRCAI